MREVISCSHGLKINVGPIVNKQEGKRGPHLIFDHENMIRPAFLDNFYIHRSQPKSKGKDVGSVLSVI